MPDRDGERPLTTATHREFERAAGPHLDGDREHLATLVDAYERATVSPHPIDAADAERAVAAAERVGGARS